MVKKEMRKGIVSDLDFIKKKTQVDLVASSTLDRKYLKPS